jgi:hypothetical protein
MGTIGLLYVKGMGKLKVLRVVVIPVFDSLVMLWLCGQGMSGPVPQRPIEHNSWVYGSDIWYEKKVISSKGISLIHPMPDSITS